MNRWVLTLFLGLCLAGCASGTKRPAPAQNPENILDELTDFEGQPFKPERKKVKLQIIEFWASWCVPCREALPAMDQLYRQYKHQGLGVLAVSVDENPEEALGFVAQIRPQFEVAWDPYGDVQTTFGVDTLPTTIMLDETGELLVRLTGYTTENHQMIHHQVKLLLAP